MASETLAPDVLLQQDNLSGVVADIDEDPGSPDTDWLTHITNNLNVVCRVSFPAPAGNPSIGVDLQEFKIWVRKQPGTGAPSVSVDLYGGGVLVANLMVASVVTSPTGELFSIPWNANLLSKIDGSDVECYILGEWSNGSPAKKCTLEVGAVEWNVIYNAGAQQYEEALETTLGEATVIRPGRSYRRLPREE